MQCMKFESEIIDKNYKNSQAICLFLGIKRKKYFLIKRTNHRVAQVILVSTNARKYNVALPTFKQSPQMCASSKQVR